jgi:hypothetical protein
MLIFWTHWLLNLDEHSQYRFSITFFKYEIQVSIKTGEHILDFLVKFIKNLVLLLLKVKVIRLDLLYFIVENWIISY